MRYFLAMVAGWLPMAAMASFVVWYPTPLKAVEIFDPSVDVAVTLVCDLPNTRVGGAAFDYTTEGKVVHFQVDEGEPVSMQGCAIVVDVPAATDGDHVIKVWVEDSDGRVGPVAEIPFVVDSVNPPSAPTNLRFE